MQDLQVVLAEARRAGARGAEALGVARAGLDLRVVGRAPPRRETWTDSELLVRVWLDAGRRGEARGRPEQASDLVATAVARAAEAPPDPFGGPVARPTAPPRGLGIDDPRHEQLTDADRLEVLTLNQRAAARADGSVAGPFWYREAREVRRFASTQGVALDVPSTTYAAGGGVDVRAGDDRLTLKDEIAGRAFASVACMPFGALLAQRAADLARPRAAVSGPQRVLLPPRACGKLVAWLADVLRDESLAPGSTFLVGLPGEPLVHRRLHLVDDGGLSGGLRTRGFDDRGVAPIPLTLLREGYVAARYVCPEAARRLDLRATGHVGANGLAPANLQLNSGTRSTSAILGEQDGLVVELDDLPDLSGVDRRTGRLDLTVHGVIRHRTAARGALRGARLRGDVLEALRQVASIASDTDRVGHVDAPALFLDGLTVEARA